MLFRSFYNKIEVLGDGMFGEVAGMVLFWQKSIFLESNIYVGFIVIVMGLVIAGYFQSLTVIVYKHPVRIISPFKYYIKINNTYKINCI